MSQETIDNNQNVQPQSNRQLPIWLIVLITFIISLILIGFILALVFKDIGVCKSNSSTDQNTTDSFKPTNEQANIPPEDEFGSIFVDEKTFMSEFRRGDLRVYAVQNTPQNFSVFYSLNGETKQLIDKLDYCIPGGIEGSPRFLTTSDPNLIVVNESCGDAGAYNKRLHFINLKNWQVLTFNSGNVSDFFSIYDSLSDKKYNFDLSIENIIIDQENFCSPNNKHFLNDLLLDQKPLHLINTPISAQCFEDYLLPTLALSLEPAIKDQFLASSNLSQSYLLSPDLSKIYFVLTQNSETILGLYVLDLQTGSVNSVASFDDANFIKVDFSQN